MIWPFNRFMRRFTHLRETERLRAAHRRQTAVRERAYDQQLREATMVAQQLFQDLVRVEHLYGSDMGEELVPLSITVHIPKKLLLAVFASDRDIASRQQLCSVLTRHIYDELVKQRFLPAIEPRIPSRPATETPDGQEADEPA